MKGIVTVVGKDNVGIISKVCTLLSDNRINILDISQSILQDYFNMIMIADFTNCEIRFEECVEILNELGKEIGVEIKLQHEDIFNTMHRI